jgi:hypothetical protein
MKSDSAKLLFMIKRRREKKVSTPFMQINKKERKAILFFSFQFKRKTCWMFIFLKSRSK